MNIIYCHTEKGAETYKFVQETIDEINARNTGIHIIKELTTLADDFSWYKVLDKYWGKDDLVTIDQDCFLTYDQLKEILDCPGRNCAFYAVAPPSSHGEKVPPHSLSALGSWNKGQVALMSMKEASQTEWATFTGCCLTKYSKEIQNNPINKFSALDRRWSGDCWILDAVNRGKEVADEVKFHIHEEIVHYHIRGRLD